MDELREYRKQNNLRVQCGAAIDRLGIYCNRCNSNNNKSKSIIAKELKAAGKCSNCRAVLDREGWFCKSCANNLKLRARIRSAERRALGLCVQCGSKTDGTIQCRRCLDMLIERRNKKKNLGEKRIMSKELIEKLRLKRMGNCKNIKDLKTWIICDLDDKEILTVYLDKEKEDVFTVEKYNKAAGYFTITVDGEKYATYFKTELFSDMFEDDISEIDIYNLELNR